MVKNLSTDNRLLWTEPEIGGASDKMGAGDYARLVYEYHVAQTSLRGENHLIVNALTFWSSR